VLNIFEGKKTVDTIMSTFNQTINELQELHDRELAEALRLDSEASALSSQAKSARAEAGRAASISSRLFQLVGDKACAA
jgi:hypothetical protein